MTQLDWAAKPPEALETQTDSIHLTNMLPSTQCSYRPVALPKLFHVVEFPGSQYP